MGSGGFSVGSMFAEGRKRGRGGNNREEWEERYSGQIWSRVQVLFISVFLPVL